ncbi:MAG: GNAT family N-acetyltransferase [Bacteroidales bacterium]
MQNIIEAVDKSLIKAELTPERMLRRTNKANNEIYVIDYHNAPNTVREIGRLREIAFRDAGGGTGLPIDLDEFDTMDKPYQQLIVWNPDAEEILGGYRFLFGDEVAYDVDGHPRLAMAHLFHFSNQFITEYLPKTLELGRSFVTLEYQSSRAGAKGLFALDNLWDGLGALTVVHPQMQYFFGKMTMYPSYKSEARDMILYFLQKHFGDPEKLVVPINPLLDHEEKYHFSEILIENDFKADYKILNQMIRKEGLNIPPLVNAYMGLSPKMKVFGTAINQEFGQVEETGILIKVDEILEEKRLRHIDSFEPNFGFIKPNKEV